MKPLNVLGGPATQATQFCDDFNRASSSDLGINWFDTTLQSVPIVNPIGSATFSIGACVDGPQGLLISYSGLANPNTQWQSGAFSVPLRNNITRTRNQFVEARFINQSGPAVVQPQISLSALVNDQLFTMYGLSLSGIVAPHPLALQRHNGTSVTVLAAYGAIVSSLDVIRLSVNVDDLANIRLEAFRNDVSLGVTIDNSVNRLTVGYAGGFRMEQFGSSGGIPSHSQWRDYCCGTGTGS